jgi:murein DD-endopeptidase MepM/ murein hydrolase activator NlpD
MFVSGVGSMPKSSVSVNKSWFTWSARLALVGCAASGLAACSGSMDRFADYPTNSVSPSAAVRSDSVQSGPLNQGTLPPARPIWQGYSPAQPTPTPAPAPVAAVVRDTAAAPPVQMASGNDWSGRVTVKRGQTLYSIARAYNVPVTELARANNTTIRHAVRVGETLQVPGQYQAASAPAPRPSHGDGAAHMVRSGETLFSIGRAYNVSPFAIAEANNLPRNYSVKTGEQLRIPGGGHQIARNDAEAAPVERNSWRQKPQIQQDEPEVAEEPAADAPAETADNAAQADEQPAAEQQAAAESEPEPAADAGFRWPVRGKVIATFGQKPNGTRNEGINIAVPEGTSVRAAESGVVAYAGNELKGYGNLVLLRHENGWVTAYAHNKDLFVRRGDTVKRGDVIAKAGQTGSVTSPQVHFELRKGATAVDPVKYLSSATASN